ncbi:hypothetical protein TYRP_010034 [Tyrophagus putrescentiae]|nr:hypothetical protein TYRP_010034 [Tyrophagus putrescentiae]
MDKTTINSAEFSRLPITTGQRTEDCFFFQFLSSSSGLTIGKQSRLSSTKHRNGKSNKQQQQQLTGSNGSKIGH